MDTRLGFVYAQAGWPVTRSNNARAPPLVTSVQLGRCPGRACTYNTYMPNKTISVPDDVVPIIESLDVPFSRWVTEQLRRHAAHSKMSLAEQLLADANLVATERPSKQNARAVGGRMERSAPW